MSEKWYKFVTTYNDGDTKNSLHVWATSMEDAERRVALIRETLKLEGKLVGATDA